jgi:hypothetical protein
MDPLCDSTETLDNAKLESVLRAFLDALQTDDESKQKIFDFIVSAQGYQQSAEESALIDGIWDEFLHSEPQISQGPENELCRPSGHGPIIFGLHVPPTLKGGRVHTKTVDPNSPTMKQMMLKQGLPATETDMEESGFWIETVFRRFYHPPPPRRKQVYSDLEPEVLNMHHELRSRLWDICSAPLGLVLGAQSFACYAEYIHSPGKKVKAIPFFEGRIFQRQACLYVEFNEDDTIKRLTVPALHPSAIFYRLAVENHAAISDLAWNFVLAASGNTSFDEDYFTIRASVVKKSMESALAKRPSQKKASDPRDESVQLYSSPGKKSNVLQQLQANEIYLGDGSQRNPRYIIDIADDEFQEENEEASSLQQEIDRVYRENAEWKSQAQLLKTFALDTREKERHAKQGYQSIPWSEWPAEITTFLLGKGIDYSIHPDTTSPALMLSLELIKRRVTTHQEMKNPALVLNMILARKTALREDVNARRVAALRATYFATGWAKLINTRAKGHKQYLERRARNEKTFAEFENARVQETFQARFRREKAEAKAKEDRANGVSEEVVHKREYKVKMRRMLAAMNKKRTKAVGLARTHTLNEIESMKMEKLGCSLEEVHRRFPLESLQNGDYDDYLLVLPYWQVFKERKLRKAKSLGLPFRGVASHNTLKTMPWDDDEFDVRYKMLFAALP